MRITLDNSDINWDNIGINWKLTYLLGEQMD